jgi:aminopeptidase N
MVFLLNAKPVQKPDPKIDVIHYEFNININDSSNIIYCTTITDIAIKVAVNSVSFSLGNKGPDGKGMTISAVLFNGKEIRWTHTGNILTLTDANTAEPAQARITIRYSGIPADGLIISKNKFGNRTFFADHWPDRASAYLPVVDHPSDKATVDFIITAPSHYEVVASGYLVEESDIPGGLKLTHWKEDVPLPVKVMTFAAADFATKLAGTVNGIPVWTWVYPENREEGFYDYSVAVKPLEFYSSLIGPYSYEKLANVQSKTIFGGLENAGCIFYSENSVTGQGKAENLIAHEVAHQWFGNSVTERDWPHIWLSEGFATYLTSVYNEKLHGSETLAESMKSARTRVLRASERSPRPVIDTAFTSLMALLNVNSYQKGAWVLHMLRYEIGDELFWKGMRNFYERFRNGNAVTDDFRKTMEEVSGRDLKGFFNQWLWVAGEPDLKINLVPGKKKGTSDILVEQVQGELFTFNIEILIKDQGAEKIVTVPVKDRITSFNVKASPGSEIIPDPHTKLLFRRVEK